MADRGGAFEAYAPERLLLFSDAVVAIAITLLAIDLPVPSGNTSSAFIHSVRHNAGHYLAFATSFVVIAVAWAQHRRVWAFAERCDTRMQRANMVWLFTIVLFPFATSLLHVDGQQTVTAHAYRFGFYSLLEVIDDGAILMIARRMVAQQLYLPGVTRQQIAAASWPCYTVVIGFGLSVPAFFATRYAWALWIIAPAVLNQIGRLRRRRASHPA